jgi:hypothetical protein
MLDINTLAQYNQKIMGSLIINNALRNTAQFHIFTVPFCSLLIKYQTHFYFFLSIINGQLQSFRRLQGYLKINRKEGKYQHLVVRVKGRKVMLMYQMRE